MKIIGQVRSVERAIGNSNQDATFGISEKRNFKIDIKPASKASAYYGYGSMQFILHGRELEESGLDLGTKIELYLVPEGTEKPERAELDDAKRELYDAEQTITRLTGEVKQGKDRDARTQRERFDATEKMRALQAENVRLTVELLSMKGAAQSFAPQPAMIEG
ncbi:MAG: hypothetical protein ABWY12_17550 [Burkholderiales bacterium]